MIDFYELLGVKKEATESEIKSAYRQMAKKYHPDINKQEDANKVIISLNEAKETLLNKEKRQKYDELLNEMKYSKQKSEDKSQTYHAKKAEYKESHSETYVTRWQYFMSYWKHGLDSKLIKSFKSIIITINYLFFSIIKLLAFCFIYLLDLLKDLINFIAILLLVIATISLFSIDSGTIQFSLHFQNVRKFIFLSFLSGTIIFIKNLMFKKYVNLLVLLQNIHDKIFIFILNKI